MYQQTILLQELCVEKSFLHVENQGFCWSDINTTFLKCRKKSWTGLVKSFMKSRLRKHTVIFANLWYIIRQGVANFFIGGAKMTMQEVSINIPDAMVEYVTTQNESSQLMRNAMILFPYIQNETISHGKAAQILGIHKMDLIALYSTLGIPYLDQTKEELESDLSVLKNLRSRTI